MAQATPTDTPQTDSQEVSRVGVVATPPDSRLQSGSRMALQPPPLGNITEEEEEEELLEEEEEEVDRDELIKSCKVSVIMGVVYHTCLSSLLACLPVLRPCHLSRRLC